MGNDLEKVVFLESSVVKDVMIYDSNFWENLDFGEVLLNK